MIQILADTDGDRSIESKIDPITGYPLGQVIATAYHEAGHAVMAMLLGVALEEATIDPDNEKCEGGEAAEKILGFVRYSFPDSFQSRDMHMLSQKAERRSLIALAGFVGEFLALGIANLSGASADMATSTDSLCSFQTRIEARYQIAYLAARCQTVLMDAWPIVIVVAEQLLLERSLNADELSKAFKCGNNIREKLRGNDDYGAVIWSAFRGYSKFECFRWMVRNSQNIYFTPYGDAAASLTLAIS